MTALLDYDPPLRRIYDLERLRTLLAEYCVSIGEGGNYSVSPWEFKAVIDLEGDIPPMSYPFQGSRLYIRECYPVYYELVMACFRSGTFDFLSVTGTPGTGKSMFYLYVFNRYRAEHPQEPIITASFRKDRTLKLCRVFFPGDTFPQIFKEIPQDIDGLHLYDGPPSGEPANGKMICFMSPNRVWLNLHEHNQRHKPIFFPPWTLDELVEADRDCELGIGPDTITKRFLFFGGSARYCLSLTDDVCAQGYDKIFDELIAIKSQSGLENLFTNGQDDQDIIHSIPYMTETFPFVTYRGFCVCSSEVLCRIWDQIEARLESLPNASRRQPITFEAWAHGKPILGDSLMMTDEFGDSADEIHRLRERIDELESIVTELANQSTETESKLTVAPDDHASGVSHVFQDVL